jgi:hypothetical protein
MCEASTLRTIARRSSLDDAAGVGGGQGDLGPVVAGDEFVGLSSCRRTSAISSHCGRARFSGGRARHSQSKRDGGHDLDPQAGLVRVVQLLLPDLLVGDDVPARPAARSGQPSLRSACLPVSPVEPGIVLTYSPTTSPPPSRR